MVLTHTMDASRTDVESCAPLKDARGCKLTLFVALQTVLLTGCLLTALYFYWTNNKAEFPEDVHIQFAPTAGFSGNTTLKFANVQHKNLMDLHDGSRISTQCRGPYIVHMVVCYISTRDQASGTVVLQVIGKQDPRSTFELQPHTQEVVCRGLQSIAYLQRNEEAELRLYSTNYLSIKAMTVGVHYLLSRCEF